MTTNAAVAEKAQVWVVDDDRSIRWVLEKALGRAGLPARMFASTATMRSPSTRTSPVTRLGTLASIVTTVPPLKRVRAVSDMVYSIRLTERSLRENDRSRGIFD